MSGLFDEAGPFARLRGASDQKQRVEGWFAYQGERLEEEPGLHAAGEPKCLVVRYATPEAASIVKTAEENEPIVTIDDQGKARVCVSGLPAAAECIILVLDTPAIQDIAVCSGMQETDPDPAACAKWLVNPEGRRDFQKYRIAATVPRLEGVVDEFGRLDVRVPVPEGSAWSEDALVVVVINS